MRTLIVLLFTFNYLSTIGISEEKEISVLENIRRAIYSAPWKKVILLSENGSNKVISEKGFVKYLQHNVKPINIIKGSLNESLPKPPKEGFVLIKGPSHGLDCTIYGNVYCIYSIDQAVNKNQTYIVVENDFLKQVKYYEIMSKSK